MPVSRKTALYQAAVAAGAKMVLFAGWELPLHFGSQVKEHHAVRQSAGLFDVSHMAILDIEGDGALAFLQSVLAGNAARLDSVGRAFYTVMLNEAGGIMDDLVVYRMQSGYRLVANAAVRERVRSWLLTRAGSDVKVIERDLALLALQGPHALELFAAAMNGKAEVNLKPFRAVAHGAWTIARTGYTGEDGIELMVPNHEAPSVWSKLIGVGAQPAGLGARDSLRLEAGFKLNGQDMDETLTPHEAGLERYVHWCPEDRGFIGRSALATRLQAGITAKLVGLVLADKGIMRRGCPVVTNQGEGMVTSGLFSPTLGCSIALARLPSDAAGAVEVTIRKQPKRAWVVEPPFVRRGRPTFADDIRPSRS